MKEITLKQISLVSGCGSEMTRAESNESWARTFGVMWAVPGTCLGTVTGLIIGSGLKNPIGALPIATAFAAIGGVVSYAVPYFITKVTLDHINLV